MGRPPKPPGERKTSKDQIAVRLTSDERARLESLAVELRVTAGEVMRRALGELYDRVFPPRKR